MDCSKSFLYKVHRLTRPSAETEKKLRECAKSYHTRLGPLREPVMSWAEKGDVSPSGTHAPQDMDRTKTWIGYAHVGLAESVGTWPIRRRNVGRALPLLANARPRPGQSVSHWPPLIDKLAPSCCKQAHDHTQAQNFGQQHSRSL